MLADATGRTKPLLAGGGTATTLESTGAAVASFGSTLDEGTSDAVGDTGRTIPLQTTNATMTIRKPKRPATNRIKRDAPSFLLGRAGDHIGASSSSGSGSDE